MMIRRSLYSRILKCFLLFFLAVSCRDQSSRSFSITPIDDIKAEESRASMRLAAENARLGEQQLQLQAKMRSTLAAQSMNAQQVEQLESGLKKNPDDLVAREKLIYFNERANNVDGRRPHILWLIEHHPDHELLGLPQVRISSVPSAPLGDPQGYAAAKQLWLSHIARADANVSVLSNAAFFFEVPDKVLAEELLLRAQMLQPEGRWVDRFARLYALALMGATDARTSIDFAGRVGNVFVLASSALEAQSSFAQAVREKLNTTKDPQLFTALGRYLMGSSRQGSPLAKSYFERAVQLDPQNVEARRSLLEIRSRDLAPQIDAMLMKLPKESRYEAVTALSSRDRFIASRELAMRSYSQANSMDVTDPDGAWDLRILSKRYADDVLKLAPQFPNSPEYSGAVFIGNILAGLVAARNGDSGGAAKYLRDAATIPASEEMAYRPPYVRYEQLCIILAGSGHRDDVIAFLEHFAQINMLNRDEILRQAFNLRK
jgi:hypothetical protein